MLEWLFVAGIGLTLWTLVRGIILFYQQSPRRLNALGVIPLLLLGFGVVQNARQQYLDKPIIDWTRSGDLARTERLLSQGADINAEVVHGRGTPLIGACGEGRLDVIRFLIAHGADINQSAYYCASRCETVTPLEAGARNPQVVTILRQAGARR